MPAQRSAQTSPPSSPSLLPTSTATAASHTDTTSACGCRFPRPSITAERSGERPPYRFCANCDQFMGFMPDLDDYDRRMSILKPIFLQLEQENRVTRVSRSCDTVRDGRLTSSTETEFMEEPCSPSTRMSPGDSTIGVQLDSDNSQADAKTQLQLPEHQAPQVEAGGLQPDEWVGTLEADAQYQRKRQEALDRINFPNVSQQQQRPYQTGQLLPPQPHSALRAATTSPSAISPLSRLPTYTPLCPPRKRYHPDSPPTELLPLQPPRQRRRLHGQSQTPPDHTDSMYVNTPRGSQFPSDRLDSLNLEFSRRPRPQLDRSDSMTVNLGSQRTSPTYLNNMSPSADIGLQHIPEPSPPMSWQQAQYSPHPSDHHFQTEQHWHPNPIPPQPLRNPYQNHANPAQQPGLDPRLRAHSPHPHQPDPRLLIPDIRYCPCGVPAKAAVIIGGGKWAPSRTVPPAEVVVLTCALERCGYYLRERVGGI